MLNNLKITNGTLLTEFKPTIYNYEVSVPDSTVFLMLEYETCDNCDVTIYGNDYLTSGESYVFIEVYDNELITYTLKVNKEESNPVIAYDQMIALEVPSKDLRSIMGPVIGVLTFFVIVIAYCIIFRRKHTIKS